MPTYTRHHVGQLIVAGFSGTTIPVELRELAREFDLGGIILFDRNIESPEQVAELAYETKSLNKELPLWVSIDQEGGRVSRLKKPFTVWPSMRTLGERGDILLAKKFGLALARELNSVGINLDYAPVLDVHTRTDNPVIGDRAFSEKASEVARLGVAIIEALQQDNIAACGKHFPGHGNTSKDSHYELPIVECHLNRLHEIEFNPFCAAIASKVAMIMTAHVLYPTLDDKMPATLSKKIITDLLKKELNFDGLVVTDDMEMGAISNFCTLNDAATQALTAGCDMMLLCGEDTELKFGVLEGLIKAVEEGKLTQQRVEDALVRQRQVKERFLLQTQEWKPPSSKELRALLSCDSHVLIAKEIEGDL